MCPHRNTRYSKTGMGHSVNHAVITSENQYWGKSNYTNSLLTHSYFPSMLKLLGREEKDKQGAKVSFRWKSLAQDPMGGGHR